MHLLLFLGFLPIALAKHTKLIPQFVLDNSPMIYLYSEENYYPGDIASYIPKFQLCLPSKNFKLVPSLKVVLEKTDVEIPDEICFGEKLEVNGLQQDYMVSLEQTEGAWSFLSLKHEDNQENKGNNTFQIPSEALFMTRHSFNPKSPFFLGVKPTSMGRAPKTPATLIVRYHHKSGVTKNKIVKETSEQADLLMDSSMENVEFIDAYWGLFYPFNEGAYVMGTGPWGNHLGDWEHVIVRFRPNVKKTSEKNTLEEENASFVANQIWLSAHSGGFAYDFSKISKYDSNIFPSSTKPIVFSARGTHANYASVGQHAHDVPFFFSALSDFSDRGLLWDVESNYYGYSFDSYAGEDNDRYIEFVPSGERENELGTEWLNYRGRWGNAKLDKSHPLQKNGYVQWRYIDGPTGPIGKNLERERICQRDYVANNYIYWNWFHLGSKCHIRKTIKKGAGLDAEKGEFVGDNCGCMLYRIKPSWLRRMLELFTWRGLLCYIMEFFTG